MDVEVCHNVATLQTGQDRSIQCYEQTKEGGVGDIMYTRGKRKNDPTSITSPDDKKDTRVDSRAEKESASLWEKRLLKQIQRNTLSTAETVAEFAAQLPEEVWSILKKRQIGHGNSAAHVNIADLGVAAIEMEKVIRQDEDLSADPFVHVLVLGDARAKNEATAREIYQEVFSSLRRAPSPLSSLPQSPPCVVEDHSRETVGELEVHSSSGLAAHVGRLYVGTHSEQSHELIR